jgi:membrane-bound serine protease (ClpP class)
MIRSLLVLFLLAQAAVLGAAEEPTGVSDSAPSPEAAAAQPPAPAPAPAAYLPAPPALSAAPIKFYVIPVRDEIAEPTLFMIRRGLKEAESAGAQFVVLDMDTPGGSLGVTLEIIEILQEKFKGRSVTFVNDEAISAGAIISSATDQIYFSPRGIIGAAAPVQSGGEEIDETMKQKILSYMRAKIEATTEGHKYRSEVLIAMMDANYELKIDDTVLKSKGELLSLTATKAMKTYGEPPTALLGAGIVDDLPALYKQLAGGAAFEVREFHVTWSLGLAQWLTRISPLLMAIGGLCLLIEFKTQGFTGLGIVGVVLFLIVFFGHNVAGLSDHVPMLVFLAGVVLVFVELFLFPGAMVFALFGAFLMLVSLVWGMADIWPGQTSSFSFDPDAFVRPLVNLSLGFLLTIVLAVVLARFMPKGLLWDRLVLKGSIVGVSSDDVTVATAPTSAAASLTGATGRAVTGLYPSGEIEVDGRRFQARVEVGSISAGATVRIVRRSDFVYIVEEVV